MRIAMVFDGLGFGGIERVGSNYARMLVNLGHEVTVFNLQPKRAGMRDAFPAACKVVDVDLALFSLPDAYFPVLKHWWGKYVYAPGYLVGKLWLGLNKAIKRANLRDFSFDVSIAFAGHIRDLSFVAYDFIKADKKLCWLHGSLESYLLLSYSYSDLYMRIGNLCVLSEMNQNYALDAFPELKRRVRITKIYNPVDSRPDIVDDALVDDLQERYDNLIVMVGRFDVDKDQATVIRSLDVMKRKYGDVPQLLFVGDGPTLDACKELAERLGLDGSIEFVGAKSNVDDFFQAARVAVHSSPAESFGMVLLEAMRNGVPVVATNSLPGVNEILENGMYGLVCNVGDPEDMAEKLHRMLNDEELQSTYRERGFERIKAFSSSAIEGQMQALLSSLE